MTQQAIDSLTAFTFDDIKDENEKEMAGIRMRIPAAVDAVILKYQEEWRKIHGRKITKEHIIWKMMAHGSQALLEEAAAMGEETENI